MTVTRSRHRRYVRSRSRPNYAWLTTFSTITVAASVSGNRSLLVLDSEDWSADAAKEYVTVERMTYLHYVMGIDNEAFEATGILPYEGYTGLYTVWEQDIAPATTTSADNTHPLDTADFPVWMAEHAHVWHLGTYNVKRPYLNEGNWYAHHKLEYNGWPENIVTLKPRRRLGRLANVLFTVNGAYTEQSVAHQLFMRILLRVGTR